MPPPQDRPGVWDGDSASPGGDRPGGGTAEGDPGAQIPASKTWLELGYQETPWGRSRASLHPEIGASLCCGVRAAPCHGDGVPLF